MLAEAEELLSSLSSLEAAVQLLDHSTRQVDSAVRAAMAESDQPQSREAQASQATQNGAEVEAGITSSTDLVVSPD